jgi:hypothetical protein
MGLDVGVKLLDVHHDGRSKNNVFKESGSE